MLRNEKYRGVFIFNRAAAKTPMGTCNHHKSKPDGEMIRIEGGMPRIVEDDVFFKVSGIIKSRSQRATSAEQRKLIC